MTINVENSEDIDFYIKKLIENTCSCMDKEIAKTIITNAFNCGKWSYRFERISNGIYELNASKKLTKDLMDKYNKKENK